VVRRADAVDQAGQRNGARPARCTTGASFEEFVLEEGELFWVAQRGYMIATLADCMEAPNKHQKVGAGQRRPCPLLEEVSMVPASVSASNGRLRSVGF